MRVIWDQILIITKGRDGLNRGFDMKLSKTEFSRSHEVTEGKKSEKRVIWGQISTLTKIRQVIPQNDAFDLKFSKNSCSE